MRALCLFATTLVAPSSPFAATPPTRAPAARRRAAFPMLRAPEYVFERSGDALRFGCSQRTITMVRPDTRPLCEFVGGSADRIVLSSWPAGQVRRRDGADDEFTISVGEFDFVALRFRIELDVRSWVEEGGAARLESTGFRMLGPGVPAGMADAITVRVAGTLQPSRPEARLCSLTGDVSFVAEGELPALLRGAPEPALRAAAHAMSSALIGAAAERFGQRVPAAYARWARGEKI